MARIGLVRARCERILSQGHVSSANLSANKTNICCFHGLPGVSSTLWRSTETNSSGCQVSSRITGNEHMITSIGSFDQPAFLAIAHTHAYADRAHCANVDKSPRLSNSKPVSILS